MLWSHAKKYKTLLDRGEVPQIAESEADRKEVSVAYKHISTQRHWALDARVYKSLAQMQRTRDSKIALEGSTERDRLRMIAWEVKTRLQPIMSLPGDSSICLDIFGAHDASCVQLIEGDEEMIIEDDSLPEHGILIRDDLPLRRLTKKQLETLKQNILTKFSGKTLTKEMLEKELDSTTADLIS